ncbi:SAM-dependent chlorinase/fluorinase [Crocosphaera sp. UHCC 0190]|uniref:SAM hydrolase/SAM-dependent halogenase family protein n=1 Tax=Crocosphaera sp. UHCC 0190 TaxID=3110246 RepID=UPI002B211C31|nr:SAM-dependent chlorinase/fluorinase [Crocosphaera sp. UHCC 0190]MEA5508788.1 SAM-dependent chlorinase/fluorinase [Crocosphaera sp. UHCC 0190]
MSKTRVIALLSDFGSQDGYVGIMKGVIASINPQITIIDLSHEIPPQQIWAGRFCLMNAYPYFPLGTVYIGVIDPGVGSQRRSVAIQVPRGYLVGPDNGLFSGVLSQEKAIAAVTLTNTNYWRVRDPSLTFHGRDIFAAVGAHLGTGVSLEQLGESIDLESLVNLTLETVKISEKGLEGAIQYIDHFGNLITNIPADQVRGKPWLIIIKNQTIKHSLTYSDGKPGELITLIGSHGWIEIAVNRGNAQKRLQVQWGDPLNLVFR